MKLGLGAGIAAWEVVSVTALQVPQEGSWCGHLPDHGPTPFSALRKSRVRLHPFWVSGVRHHGIAVLAERLGAGHFGWTGVRESRHELSPQHFGGEGQAAEQQIPPCKIEENDHLLYIEFRPNDLASPRTACLTDDLPPILELTGCDKWLFLNTY